MSVTSFSDTAAIRDGRFLNLKGKDAIVDRFQQVFGHRPDSGPDRGRTVSIFTGRINRSLFIWIRPVSLCPDADTERFPSRPDAGNPGRGGGSGIRLEGKWKFHQSHVRQRNAGHRGGVDRPGPGTRAGEKQLWIHASEGVSTVGLAGYPD